MIDNLESATFEEIRRIWKYLEGKEMLQEEFATRLQSQEAQAAFLSAVFHGLRTSDPEKHMRLGRLTVNCIFAADMKPESLDGMMRAAVELTEADTLELGAFHSRQSIILADAEKTPMQWYEDVRDDWHRWIIERSVTFREGGLSYLDRAGSRPRLAALGFIVAIPPRGTSNSPEEVPYALLPEGERFYDRLQDVAIDG